MSELLDRCLADLEQRIDERQEQENLQAYLAFLAGRCPDDLFIPPARRPAPPKVNWPDVTVNQAVGDVEAMLLQQFRLCSDVLAAGGGSRLNVRCNYGSGILPTLFGCEPFLMDDQVNTLPTARPLGSSDKVKALLDAGLPDLRGGLGARVFQAAERFLLALKQHPVLERNVALYHPDLQGPLDAAELIWGSEVFYAFHDDQKLLSDFLGLIADTYIAFMRSWYGLAGKPSLPRRRPGEPGECSTHWGMMHGGAIMIRNDTLTNLSPQAYVEHVRPMDQRLLDAFGGGAMHFCGRGDHYIEPMSQLRGLSAVNLSQPELNDMETICRNTIDKGIKLIGLTCDVARALNRPTRGRVQCFGEAETLTFAHKGPEKAG